MSRAEPPDQIRNRPRRRKPAALRTVGGPLDLFDRPGWDIAKDRPCLICRGNFRSEWSGERICGRCKRRTRWRSPEPDASGRHLGRSRVRTDGRD